MFWYELQRKKDVSFLVTDLWGSFFYLRVLAFVADATSFGTTFEVFGCPRLLIWLVAAFSGASAISVIDILLVTKF